MDRLTEIAIFVAIAEHGSLSAAGRALGLGASAVSKRLAGLEARLGARLITRTTRALTLTEAGTTFLGHCQAILAQAEAAERAVGAAQRAPQGTLRLAAPMSFGVRRLAPILPEFLAAHPGLRLDLEFSDRYVDLVEDGFDLALRIGDLADSTLTVRRLGVMPVHLVASPAYLAARGQPGSLAELAGHDHLVYALQRDGEGWLMPEEGRLQRVPLRARVRANTGEALVAAAMAGLGIARLPEFLVADGLARGALTRVMPACVAPPVAVQALLPPGRHMPAKTRVILDFLLRRLAFTELNLSAV